MEHPIELSLDGHRLSHRAVIERELRYVAVSKLCGITPETMVGINDINYRACFGNDIIDDIIFQ
jgi:hypothetical protein